MHECVCFVFVFEFICMCIDFSIKDAAYATEKYILYNNKYKRKRRAMPSTAHDVG